MSMIPSNGKSAKGNSAVTEMETASVIHHSIIHEATANTGSSVSEISVSGQAIMAIQSNGPKTNPSFLYAPKLFTWPKLLKFTSLPEGVVNEIVCVVNPLYLAG